MKSDKCLQMMSLGSALDEEYKFENEKNLKQVFRTSVACSSSLLEASDSRLH